MVALPLWFVVASLTILGAIWGSFVAALCSRWPKGESIARGRSGCDHCNSQIAAHDLIPIASYIVLKGKCRNCGQSIDLLSFLIELVAALIGLFPMLIFPEIQAVAVSIFGWLLLPLVVLDHKHLWLPNRLVLTLAMVGLLIGPVMTPIISMLERFAGLIVGFLSLEIVRQGYRQFRRQDGMGAGDPKMFAALGVWVGWQGLPIVLLGASAIGLLSVWLGRLTAQQHRLVFPFGSYLGVSAFFFALVV